MQNQIFPIVHILYANCSEIGVQRPKYLERSNFVVLFLFIFRINHSEKEKPVQLFIDLFLILRFNVQIKILACWKIWLNLRRSLCSNNAKNCARKWSNLKIQNFVYLEFNHNTEWKYEFGQFLSSLSGHMNINVFCNLSNLPFQAKFYSNIEFII